MEKPFKSDRNYIYKYVYKFYLIKSKNYNIVNTVKMMIR